jgi:hypothetical protein
MDDNDEKVIVPEHSPDKPPEETPKVVEPAPGPPKHDDGLADRVSALETLVNGIVSDGGVERDSQPVSKPWTHWGKK